MLVETCLYFNSFHQMGSSMKEAVFTDETVMGLRRWHKIAKKRLQKRKLVPETTMTRTKISTKNLSQIFQENKSVSTRRLMRPLPSPRVEASSSSMHSFASRFKYPSGRLELMEIQRVAEEMIECSANNIPFDGEMSFRYMGKPRRVSA